MRARGVELAGAAPDRARGPVDAAQLVDDGASDAGGGDRLNGTPRSGSKAWAAWTSAASPAEVRSSRSTCAGTLAMVSRTMCPTRGTCTTINASEPGGTSLSWVTLAIVDFKAPRPHFLADSSNLLPDRHGGPDHTPGRDISEIRRTSRWPVPAPIGYVDGSAAKHWTIDDHEDFVEKLTWVLWRERELLEALLFRLELEELVMARPQPLAGRRRSRRGHAAAALRELEVLRAVAADEAAAPSASRRTPASGSSSPSPKSRGARSSAITATPSSP